MEVDLKDLLEKTAAKHLLQGGMQASMVISKAQNLMKEAFPAAVFSAIHFEKFQKGILWCSVDNAAVAQELQLKSHTILQKLNEELKSPLVKSIRSHHHAKVEEFEELATPDRLEDEDFFA